MAIGVVVVGPGQVGRGHMTAYRADTSLDFSDLPEAELVALRDTTTVASSFTKKNAAVENPQSSPSYMRRPQ